MRAVPILLLLTLAGCGGSEGTRRQGDNVALDPAVLQPKPTATSIAGVDFTKPIRGFGTEPFWAIDIAPGKVRFEDLAVDGSVPTDWAPQPPRITGNVAVIDARTPAGEAATVTLTGESCLEVGEEADALPLKASVKIGARTLTGCAGQRLPPPGSPEAENAAR
jgi:uncharacterized membrane protein